MGKTSLKDIARELSISISQVSRALNSKPYVAPEIKAKVLQLAQKKNYRNLSGKHQRTVAVIIQRLEYFNNAIINEILTQAERLNWQIVIVPYKNITTLCLSYLDGAIWISGEQVGAEWNNNFNIPLVTINNFGSALNRIHSVFPDADMEIRLAFEHFIALGHSRIARVRPCHPNAFQPELERGLAEFQRLAQVYGVPNNVCNCFCASLHEYSDTIIKLVKKGYTAFIVVIDEKAPLVLKLIQNTGIRVPEDISIIFYESVGAEACNPELTTIQYDFPKLVSTALKQLDEEIRTPKIVQQIIVPCVLNIRKSTGRRA